VARVLLTAPFDARFVGGAGERAVAARDLFELVRKLDAEAPGFALAVEEHGLIAVDGAAVADWSHALTEGSEVLVVPRIAGG